MAESSKQDQLIKDSKEKNQKKFDAKDELTLLAEKLRAGYQSPETDNITLVKKLLTQTVQGVASENIKERKLAAKQGKMFMQSIQAMELDLGDQQESLLNKFKEISDKADKQVTATSIMAKELTANTLKSLPTLKGFMDAIVTHSNPLVKVGMNMFKDFKRVYTDANKQVELQAKDKKTALKEEKLESKKTNESLQQVAKENVDVLEKTKQENNKAKVKRTPGQGPLVSRMEALRAENVKQTFILTKLLKEWTGEEVSFPSETAPNEVDINQLKVAEETDKKLDKLVAAAEETVKQNEALVRSDALKERDTQKAKLVGKTPTSGKDVIPAFGAKRKEIGLIGTLMSGLMAGVAAFLSPITKGFEAIKKMPILGTLGKFFTGVSEFFGKFAKMVPGLGKLLGMAKGAGPIGIVITAVMGIIDFVDGFRNAGDILGKEDVDMRDRISAGIGSIVGGVVGILDMMLGWIGIDTKMGEKVKEWNAKFLSALLHPIDTVRGLIEDAQNSDWLKAFKDGITDIMNLPSVLIEGMKSMVRSAIDVMPSALVPDSLKNWAAKDEAPVKREFGPAVPNVGHNSIKLKETNVGTPSKSSTALPKEDNSRSQAVADYENKVNELNEAKEKLDLLKKQREAAAIASVSVRNNVDNSQTVINNSPLVTRNNDRSLHLYP